MGSKSVQQADLPNVSGLFQSDSISYISTVLVTGLKWAEYRVAAAVVIIYKSHV